MLAFILLSPFTDYSGYKPVNSPWDLTDSSRWQPLIESDDLGFFYAQEHVVPHIGIGAVPAVLTRDEVDKRFLDDPNYDYVDEVEKTLDEVANLDDYKSEMVMFMDNKINIAGGMIMRLRGKYNLSLEAQVFYHYGYTSVELDTIILAWKEKVAHDRVRPTSLVQALGDHEVTSFAGSHQAKDWVPLIRVMPHAEYPSGSACLCLGIAQYIDAFVSDQYGDDSVSTTWSFSKSGDKTFENMTELAEVCGTSRLWGGMHFTKSVPDAYELCDDVGTVGYNRLMLGLLGSGTYYDDLQNDANPKFCDAAPDDMFCETSA